MGQWMTAPEAFGFLVLAAALLAALLPCAVWPTPLPRTSAVLATCGLLLAAFALRMLKLKTGTLGSDENPDFWAARNGESFALAAVPMALALTRQAHVARAGALAFGLLGAWLLAAWLMPGGEDWGAAMQREDRFAASTVPGLARFATKSNVQDARWLWCIGAVLAALPLAQLLLRRFRERALSGEDEVGLGFALAGLSISAAAMGIFFWHASDFVHGEVVRTFLEVSPFLALLLALTHGRLVSATWVRLGFTGFSALIAAWLALGAPGADLSAGQQSLGDAIPFFLLLAMICLAVPVLALHGAGALALAGARGFVGLFRRRSAAA